MSPWRETVLAALVERDPERKVALVSCLLPPLAGEGRDGGGWAGDESNRPHPGAPPQAGEGEKIPGRPDQPILISPREVPHRGLGTLEGRAALIHAVTHIEFNAINLALDAAWRFGGMPDEFHADWISVAQDEARHFELLSNRLRELGYAYGDFAAHNGLWEAAEKTAHDALARMALVPRVLEARGLDVTPGMILRLREVGDDATRGILELILREELRHVAIGDRWFRVLCEARGLAPEAEFRRLLDEHGARVRPPLNREARLAAGFTASELDAL